MIEVETVPPTATSDRVCSPTTLVTCNPYTICTPGIEYISTPGGVTSDVVCSNLTQCASNQYESQVATTTSDRVCTNTSITRATVPWTFIGESPLLEASDGPTWQSSDNSFVHGYNRAPGTSFTLGVDVVGQVLDEEVTLPIAEAMALRAVMASPRELWSNTSTTSIITVAQALDANGVSCLSDDGDLISVS